METSITGHGFRSRLKRSGPYGSLKARCFADFLLVNHVIIRNLYIYIYIWLYINQSPTNDVIWDSFRRENTLWNALSISPESASRSGDKTNGRWVEDLVREIIDQQQHKGIDIESKREYWYILLWLAFKNWRKGQATSSHLWFKKRLVTQLWPWTSAVHLDKLPDLNQLRTISRWLLGPYWLTWAYSTQEDNTP